MVFFFFAFFFVVQEELKFALHFIVACYKTEPLEDTLANFVIRYRLPYIAQVLEGVDTPTGACSLSLNDILTIHTVLRLKRIKVKNSKGKYFFLPVDNSARVEIVPKTRTRHSEGGLRSHARRPVTFLRTLTEIPELNLEDGDILDPVLNDIAREKKAGPETLKCKILHEPDREIRLPLDYVMPFESFEEFDPRSYSLRYVADNIAFPVAVRFIGDVKFSPKARVALKGEFCFEEIVEESIVIATTKLPDQFTMLKLPVDLQVTVFPIRKLRCNAEYIRQYWKRLQPEINKLEMQITNVGDDLMPTSFFQENTLSVRLEGSGDIDNHEAMSIVDTVDECVSALDGDGHVYEAMDPSISGRRDQRLYVLEGIEDYYETMELPIATKVCEYMSVPEGGEDEYEIMETTIARKLDEYRMSVLDGCEHVYEAMKSSNTHKFSEGLPYSRAKSRQRTSSTITQGYGEKPLYSSLVSFPQDSASMERSPHV